VSSGARIANMAERGAMSSEYVRQRLLEAIESHRKSIADLEENLSREDSPSLRRQKEWHQKEVNRLETELQHVPSSANLTEVPSHRAQQEHRRSSSSANPPDSPPIQQPQVTSEPEKPSHPQQPGQVSVTATWLVFAVVLLASFSLSAYFLQDPRITLTVFLAFLISLTILLPFIGLNIRILRESNWFKTYLAALDKIPGLHRLIDPLVRRQENRSGK